MVSNLLETDVENVLDTAFGGDDEELLVVDPSAETIVSLVEAATGRDDLPSLSMLADERTLKDVMDDFLIASKAADLVADGSLGLRVLSTDVDNALFVSPSRLVVLVGAGEHVAALSTEEADFVDEVFATHRDAFEAAEEYVLRTPALSRVRETMAAEIGEPTREDFDAVLASMESTDSGLDEVTVSLLVAAKNDVLLYDISKWGEDVGIASKATFSRTKTRLEDLGVIDTEKVPIDVGRPRLRLKLGDERLQDIDAEDLAAAAGDLLA
ncbi:transcriptional regulator TbsP [Halorubrum sp. HHNYT27]|uniref:transcriptional regulator TbsP n=1 Tax=Halorubrum sp. HHNYT27 TaxID=3402275 RepID=UPI003EB6EC73